MAAPESLAVVAAGGVEDVRDAAREGEHVPRAQRDQALHDTAQDLRCIEQCDGT